ncbi:Uncharacterized protein OS=Acidovorax citrulli (strain AAC00-1) GN=Aave_2362 PE=4 SV=1 [Gemmataceae bacterium]|nr:Uncharacterized protein OS=Acidovorax citrulli (strain AAC00-1) GN=Aave_2362 PE=4 SV=1 [Gemmataceae bacterium]VTU01030.1 Uncharacterized protein OS=Acidovorax citrulli (strain AAC00-1) GN=Aave_2362 PE=4 SV=1 [Gemmataceae bacterium]
MKPTVGRVVYFYPAASRACFGFWVDKGKPLAAIVAHVEQSGSSTYVNVSVIDKSGKHFPVTAVPFAETEQPDCPIDHCAWMPYQRERHAKDEIAARNDMHTEAMTSI